MITPLQARGIQQLAGILQDNVSWRTEKIAYPTEWEHVTLEEIEGDILLAFDNLKNYIDDCT